MAVAVYILCLIASLTCAWMLGRSYYETRLPLLLWSGLCFFGLAINNAFLICDLVLFPHAQLSVPRNLTGAISVSLLIYGLLWKKGLSVPQGGG